MKLRSLCLLFLPFTMLAQDPPATPASPPAPPVITAAQAPAPPPAESTEPDYPDPRTFSLGIFYWFRGPGDGPDLRTGKQAPANSNQSLDNLGKTIHSPGVEVSLPISRTGDLHFELFRVLGNGNQTAPADGTYFASDFTKGDLLSTSYKITAGKFYLEDLLFPHKFPVAKFRLKSVWALNYVSFRTSIDAITGSQNLVLGGRSSFLPTFGVVAEFAPARHVLFRIGGSGFTLPGRSLIWDGEATLGVRRGHIEVLGGGKAFSFRTSPNKESYARAQVVGAFAGIRYHFGQ